MKTNIKNGISLIVLVITIIVMIILAATIIISLNNAGIIGAAHNAVCMTNIKQAQNLAVLTWSNMYTNPDDYNMDNIEQKLKDEFEKNGLKYEDYNVEITKNGIEVSSKAGCTDSSGVEGGNNNTPPTNWNYAYTYNRAADKWAAVTTNEGVEPTGDVVIRMYKVGSGEKTYQISEDYEMSLTGDWYKMIVSGTGKVDIATLMDSEISITKDTYYWDEVVPMPIECFTVDLEVQEGITEVSRYNSDWEDAFACVETLKLPSTLKVIGEDFIRVNYALEELEIPEGVTAIESDAFAYCEKLKSVKLPGSLTKLGACAFEASGITEIKLPKSLTTIEIYSGYGPFANCEKLKIVTIPAGITNLNNAFIYCDNIETVYFEGTEAQWNAVENKCIPSTATIICNYTGY